MDNLTRNRKKLSKIGKRRVRLAAREGNDPATIAGMLGVDIELVEAELGDD